MRRGLLLLLCDREGLLMVGRRRIPNCLEKRAVRLMVGQSGVGVAVVRLAAAADEPGGAVESCTR